MAAGEWRRRKLFDRKDLAREGKEESRKGDYSGKIVVK